MDYANRLQFTGHEEGRIRAIYGTSQKPDSITSFAFDYFLKDHLGNVRMVLTDEMQVDRYPTATLESNAVKQEQQFYGIDTSRVVLAPSTAPLYVNDNGFSNPNTYGTPTANSQKMYQLNGSTNKTGLSLILKVMTGDSVNIYAKSYYRYSGTASNSVLSASELITSFLGSGGSSGNPASIHGATVAGLNANTAGTFNPLNLFTNSNPVNPTNNVKAGINYIIFDEQFNYVSGSSDPVNTGTKDSVKTHILQNMVMPKNGYIYIYCSNESNINVFFDNLEVKQTRGPILEETHYYPFGLAMAGISSKAAGKLINKKKYNGKELQSAEFSDGSGLELYDYCVRMQDPQLGRWWTIDPMASHPKQVGTSPYTAFNNNPIRYVDPTGMIWEDPKEAEKLNKSVNNKIESINKDNTKIQAKINKGGLSEKKLGKLQDKIADNNSKVGLLNQSLSDIKTIGEAKEIYALTGPSQDNGTHGVLKDSKGVIQIEGSNTGLHLHEIRHVGQSIEAGGVKFNSKGQLLNSASTKEEGRNNEVNAYQIGFSFDGQYPNSTSSLKDINQKSLMEIKLLDGTPVYEKLKD